MKKTIAILAALSLIAAVAPTVQASDASQVNNQNNAVVASGGCVDDGAGGGGATGQANGINGPVTDGGEDDAGVGVTVVGGPSATVDAPSVTGAVFAIAQLAEGIAVDGRQVSPSGTNFCDGSTGYIEIYVYVSSLSVSEHVCFDGNANLLTDCDNNAGELVGPVTV